MAKKTKKYYIVVNGSKPGIYRQWHGPGGAAEQVENFPGAIYKGFYTREEAMEWLQGFDQAKLADLAPYLLDQVGLRPPDPSLESPSALLKAGKVLIYTDGGAIDNPGPGGYGVVLRSKGHRKELSGGYRWTTNNRMELLACIEGLKILKRGCSVVLFSDSKYVVDGMTKGWAERWQTSGWTLSTGQPVKNADLWQQLLALCQKHRVEFRWVRGHSGNPDNERCDQLATAAAQRQDLAVDVIYEKAQ
jgi:ribonuclease HI